MRRSASSATAVAVAVAFGVACASRGAAPSSPPALARLPDLPPGRVRVVEAEFRKTLREQLLPGDEVVHFLATGQPEPVGPKLEELAQAVAISDEVLLVEVTETSTELIYKETWAHTVVRSRVTSVFKAPPGSVRIGDERLFEIGGGQVVIDGVIVQVLSPMPYAKGRRYLVTFGRKDSFDGLYRPYGAMPLLQQGNSFLAYPGFSEHLSGVTIDDVRRAVNATR